MGRGPLVRKVDLAKPCEYCSPGSMYKVWTPLWTVYGWSMDDLWTVYCQETTTPQTPLFEDSPFPSTHPYRGGLTLWGEGPPHETTRFRETMRILFSMVDFPRRVCIKALSVVYCFKRVMAVLVRLSLLGEGDSLGRVSPWGQ